MSNVKIDFTKCLGKIKDMHAVNNGPIVAGSDQTRGNHLYYKAAKIPYARNHDAAFDSRYGGEHTVDVCAIFPNFDADVNDPASYDFPCTDHYTKQIIEAGTKPFYRLGSKIEHGIKKYGTVMPKDFKKWAEICEHIIRHYTEGWADGFYYDIEYWEIWNEPDLDPDDSTNKRCWSGTEKDFARLYVIASNHLKTCFPHLKIGGPALAWNEDWLERFFENVREFNGGKNPPLDFLSWHWYGTEPVKMSEKGTRIYDIAVKAGYEGFESILNEWNYVRGWSAEFIYSLKTIIGMKGAAFTSACMTVGQKNPKIDMLMYYDARPTGMNGLFDYYTLEPLKGYYPFLIYSNLKDIGTEAESVSDDGTVYSVCAYDGKRAAIMLTYYSEDDDVLNKSVTITAEGFDLDNARVYITDEENTMSLYPVRTFENNTLTLFLKRNSIVYIEK
ncbi:MAG: hypothetical protein IJ445_02800 [Clostridia bacterium]|nr:hypothetical protein [Clostridia bacterium]